MVAPNEISIKNKTREFIIVLVTVCASVALLYSILFSAGIGDVTYTETGTDARASIYDADGNLLQSNADPEGWVSNHGEKTGDFSAASGAGSLWRCHSLEV